MQNLRAEKTDRKYFRGIFFSILVLVILIVAALLVAHAVLGVGSVNPWFASFFVILATASVFSAHNEMLEEQRQAFVVEAVQICKAHRSLQGRSTVEAVNVQVIAKLVRTTIDREEYNRSHLWDFEELLQRTVGEMSQRVEKSLRNQ